MVRTFLVSSLQVPMSIVLSFLFFTGLVAFLTWRATRSENLATRQGYFLAGNSLGGWVIAGSLMLTNLSAANFIGMSGLVYKGDLSPIAWTVTVVPPLIYFCMVLLPAFLKGGFTTIPEFLEQRFGASTRRLVAILFLLSYILTTMPGALYGGAVAINLLFSVDEQLGLSREQSIWLIVWSLGIIGGLYALFGGLRGIAVSDSFNGIGLLIGGAIVFVVGIYRIGDENIVAGLSRVCTTETHKIDAVGDVGDSIPFAVLFTGMVLQNLYFWSTNQFIVQRTLGARSLREGQKGVMIAAFFKIINICYIALPGVIAYHLYGPGQFADSDWVYATLVRDLMPQIFIGFFAAVIFGTVLSTFNSVLGSSVTIIALDIYRPLFGRHLDEDQLIRHSKIFGLIVGVMTMVIAPFIMYFPEGIFTYIIKVSGLFGVPIFLVMLLGFCAVPIRAWLVNILLLTFMLGLGLAMFAVDTGIHYLHVMAMLFTVFFSIAWLAGWLWPKRGQASLPEANGDIDLTPWPHLRWVSVLALICMVATYVLLSPLGLVQTEQTKSIDLGPIILGSCTILIMLALPLIRARRRDKD